MAKYSTKGFTLIELLTVMAIIAVLAGITFPVLARVKENAYKSADISNMSQLNNALQLYRADQDSFPPAILGYATLYTADSNVVPADLAHSFLVPGRISSVRDLQPSTLRAANTAITRAVWPKQDPAAVGTAPYAGLASGCSDTSDNRQKFGSSTLVKRPLTLAEYQARASEGQNPDIDGIGIGPSGADVNAYFYNISGYDVATVKTGGIEQTEIHYTRFWTGYGLGSGNRCDDPRQLGYANPPADTVVTWLSQYRDYDSNGNATATKKDVVLTLGGSAKPASSADLATRSWRFTP